MLYTFYGDDFTGSTDVLEQLASNGVPTALFLRLPDADQLARFKDIEALGIAGDSRSRSPEWMAANLPRIFAAMKQFNAPINHYKVCSTFDSSPTHGSIGRAIELGREVFSPEFIPVVVAAPHLGRYVVFSNLFAVCPDGTIQRIDRHPMAQHPVTPMHEADLCRHLAAQTKLAMGQVDLTAIQSGCAVTELDRQLAEGRQVIFFDGVDPTSIATTGELLWQRALERSIFSASSSGLTAAIVSAWRKSGITGETLSPAPANNKSEPLLIISGSCSTVTANQIRHALENGSRSISIDPCRFPGSLNSELERVRDAAATSLADHHDVVLHTALGASSGMASGDALGRALGHLLRDLLAMVRTRRVVLCGGDTSSHALEQLDLYALTWAASIQPGAPLCRAWSEDPSLDGLELVLKGGQTGTPDFFEAVRTHNSMRA